ncbi:MAG: branched-chain amino acid ABC transporter permease [Haloarculaceae archaeon]
MVYSIAEVPNFAHGDMLTLGAYMALLVNKPGNVPLLNLLTTGEQSMTTGGLIAVFLIGLVATLGAIYMLGGREALLGSFWPLNVPGPVALVVHVAIGAIVGIIAAWGVPSIIAAMLFSGAVVAALGPLQERYLYGKFRAKDVSIAMMLVVSLAMAFVLRFTIQTIFGGTARTYSLEPEIQLFGASVNTVVVKFFDFYFTSGGFLLKVTDPVNDAVLFNGFFSWVAFVGMIVVAIAVGYAGYRYRKGTRAVLGPYLLGSILGVLAFVIVGVFVSSPSSIPQNPLYSSRIKLSILNAFIIALALAMMGLLHTLLRATQLGKAMRATSDNRDLAEIRGINVDQVTMGVWVIAGLYAGLGGTTLGILFGTLTITMGFYILLPMFAAVILGGITIYGALLGSYLVGLSMEIGIFALPIGATYRVPVAFVVLMIVLLVKPEGITG